MTEFRTQFHTKLEALEGSLLGMARLASLQIEKAVTAARKGVALLPNDLLHYSIIVACYVGRRIQ